MAVMIPAIIAAINQVISSEKIKISECKASKDRTVGNAARQQNKMINNFCGLDIVSPPFQKDQNSAPLFRI